MTLPPKAIETPCVAERSEFDLASRGACIHYYFYWIHPELGLIHVRVPNLAAVALATGSFPN
jgi:hypothetical protein